MDLSFDPVTFSGWAPLFPLPGVVLLPGALLPLHVFEPRYRLMLKDALEGEKLIAIALLRPGFERDYQGAPAIEQWVGLGRIVAHAPLPDGRSNLILAGLRRARVVEEDRERAYRRGKLEVAEDDEDALPLTERAALRSEVLGLLEQVSPELVRDPVRLGVARKIQVPLGPLVDLAADALELGVSQKQSLLAEARVKARAQRLVALVKARMDERAGRRAPWPPRFSKN